MFILGIIPARGGSKEIPKKNLYPLCGKPLIQYTIEAALASKLNDVVVSTDDDEIMKVAHKQCDVYKRPDELAQDDTPMVPVIQHAVQVYEEITGKHVDVVMTLQPTSPLRRTVDINDALTAFQLPVPQEWRYKGEEYADNLVSVTWGIHPIKSYAAKEGEQTTPFITGYYDKHKHKCFTRNGAVFLTRRDLLDKGELMNDKPIFLLMPKTVSIDIDDMEDMEIAEAILKARGGEEG